MKPRYNKRIHIQSPVIFTIGSGIGEGRVLDITVPGCLIESPISVKRGDYLQLKLFLLGLKSPIAVALAAVRWTDGSQFGVEFIRMEEKERPSIEHPNDAIVKVQLAAICGSDLHLYHGMMPDTRVA